MPGDFEKIYEIDQACYEPRIAYSRTELRQYLRFPGADCVIAEAARGNSSPTSRRSSARAVGAAFPPPETVGFCITARRDVWGYIVTMDVLAPYRRLGVASQLLAEAERRMISHGVREIGLETATDNSAAIAFWQKHGYRKSGVRKNYYPGGRDAYSMAKRIAALQSAATGK